MAFITSFPFNPALHPLLPCCCASSPKPMPRLAVSTAVFRLEPCLQLLLIQRAKPPNQHLWAFPGGKLKPNESLLSAAYRELLEETGVAEKHIHMLPSPATTVLVPDNTSPSYQIHLFAALSQHHAIHIQAADDAEDAAFYDLQQLSTLSTVANLQTNALIALSAIRAAFPQLQIDI